MKPKFNFAGHVTVFTIALFLAACSGNQKEAEVTDTLTSEEAESHEHERDITRNEAGKPEFTVDEIFQKQLGELFGAYVELKDAFISSDASKVKEEAADAKEQLAKVDMKMVEGPAHNDWMIYHGELSSAIEQIESSSDIEVQREHFSKLSYSLYKAIKAYGLGGTTAYYDYCPMAFNDKGAYWLSNDQKIRNPYFGDKMLTCGRVEETLQ